MDKLVGPGSPHLPMYNLEWVNNTELVDVIAMIIADTPGTIEELALLLLRSPERDQQVNFQRLF